MGTLVHADIFFFITSIFVVILAIGTGVGLFFLILILRDLRHMSALARAEGDKLVGDIEQLRGAAKEEGQKIRSVFDFMLALFTRRQGMKQKKKSTTNNKLIKAA